MFNRANSESHSKSTRNAKRANTSPITLLADTTKEEHSAIVEVLGPSHSHSRLVTIIAKHTHCLISLPPRASDGTGTPRAAAPCHPFHHGRDKHSGASIQSQVKQSRRETEFLD
ncbi:hypothetical protein RIF29_34043 [Crotalaria pallida]|uniref:Uncharacterized protein n=1 Tax=Crotalaria pallida TaxID=3830 RepID=A0AAN9E8I0_CROPI